MPRSLMQRAAVMLAVIALAGTALAAGADGSKSAPIAHRLATVLAERHLDAIASADPSSPDRFVAALLYPDVQLLVVGGRYAAPEAMRAQIAAHRVQGCLSRPNRQFGGRESSLLPGSQG